MATPPGTTRCCSLVATRGRLRRRAIDANAHNKTLCESDDENTEVEVLGKAADDASHLANPGLRIIDIYAVVMDVTISLVLRLKMSTEGMFFFSVPDRVKGSSWLNFYVSLYLLPVTALIGAFIIIFGMTGKSRARTLMLSLHTVLLHLRCINAQIAGDSHTTARPHDFGSIASIMLVFSQSVFTVRFAACNRTTRARLLAVHSVLVLASAGYEMAVQNFSRNLFELLAYFALVKVGGGIVFPMVLCDRVARIMAIPPKATKKVD